MIKYGNKEQQELRELLLKKVMKDPKSKAQIANEIGISVITLTKFLEKEQLVEFKAFLKIKNYIEDNK